MKHDRKYSQLDLKDKMLPLELRRLHEVRTTYSLFCTKDSKYTYLSSFGIECFKGYLIFYLFYLLNEIKSLSVFTVRTEYNNEMKWAQERLNCSQPSHCLLIQLFSFLLIELL